MWAILIVPLTVACLIVYAIYKFTKDLDDEDAWKYFMGEDEDDEQED